ncbi:MAG: TolC family outer membrane protein [Lysobacteraceae bacterium]
MIRSTLKLFALKALPASLLLAFAASAGASDLMQAYDLARQNDPTLSIAETTRTASQLNVDASRSALLPRLTGSAGYSRSGSDVTSHGLTEAEPAQPFSRDGGSHSRGRSLGLDLSQSLYDHGNYTRLRSARKRAEAGEAEFEAANDGLIVRVAQGYFDTLTAIDALVFALAEERAVKRQLDQAEVRFEVGADAITDVHEARARYDSSRANTIASEVMLEDAREALAEILGSRLQGLKGLDENFQPTPLTPASMEDWVALTLDKNPILLAQDISAQADELDVATARSGHLPSLSASAGWGKTFGWGGARGPGLVDHTDGDDWNAGISLVVPIFAGFATQTGVKQAINTRDARAFQYEQSRRSILRQTRNSFRALQAGISEIEARKQAVVSAQSALEATEAGFEVGTRTIVDVLLSQQSLFMAQSGYSSARHNFLVNTLRLKQAAGTVELSDLADVNRYLVSDAEAALHRSADENAGN